MEYFIAKDELTIGTKEWSKLPSVTVITPSVGSKKLSDAIASVKNQTYSNIRHCIVFDGVVSGPFETHDKLDFCVLPYNTGKNGFYGHRIYSAFTKLIDTDYIFFLDEDNTYEPDHVKDCITEFLKGKHDLVYSLRNVVDENLQYVCQDNCESLGIFPTFQSDSEFLIDTSSYAFKTSFIRKYGYLWDNGWGADRTFLKVIKQVSPNIGFTGKYTLNYRLSGNSNSVSKDFFIHGNIKQLEKYAGVYPWVK